MIGLLSLQLASRSISLLVMCSPVLEGLDISTFEVGLFLKCWSMESMHSEWVPLGVSACHTTTTPNGDLQTPKVGFQKFVSSILSDVEKITEFGGEHILQNGRDQKWRRYHQKNTSHQWFGVLDWLMDWHPTATSNRLRFFGRHS